MRPCGRLDKLSGDTDPVRRFAHAAFEQIAHTKFPADLLCIHRPAFEHKGGVSRDDKEPTELRKGRYEIFCNSIRKIFLFRIA
jgi:hypothetical protein